MADLCKFNASFFSISCLVLYFSFFLVKFFLFYLVFILCTKINEDDDVVDVDDNKFMYIFLFWSYLES